jgi:hypothetical protein
MRKKFKLSNENHELRFKISVCPSVVQFTTDEKGVRSPSFLLLDSLIAAHHSSIKILVPVDRIIASRSKTIKATYQEKHTLTKLNK